MVGLYNGRFNAVGDLLYRGPSGWVSAWFAALDDITEAVSPMVTDTLGHLHVLWCDGTDQVRYQHRK